MISKPSERLSRAEFGHKLNHRSTPNSARGRSCISLVLGRRRGGGGIFGGGENAVAILVGALELADGLRRPFLERQRSVAVESSLAKAFLRGSSSSVGSIRPSLFLSARLKRFSSRLLGSPRALPMVREPRTATRRGARWRRTGQARPALGARLPNQEHPGEKQESRGCPGKETQHTESPSRRRFGTRTLRNGAEACQLRLNLPGQPVTQQGPGARRGGFLLPPGKIAPP